MVTWRGETQAEVGFEKALTDFGYHPNYVQFHCNQDHQRLNRALEFLKKQDFDLIYVFGTTATSRVVKHISRVPIIFNIVTRPVASGIIADWKSSGNNAVGVSSKVPIEKQIKALKKVLWFSRLGIIYNPRENNSIIQSKELNTLAGLLGFQLIHFKISNERDVDQKLKNSNKKVDAVFLLSDSTVKILGKKIMDSVNKNRLPSLAALEEMVINDGAMMGLSPNYYHLGRLAARKAHSVLTDHHPSEIESVTSAHFNITINLRTAKNIGIHIPTGLLVMADKIVR